MIRIETETDWLLLSHKEHAKLAGEFARHWKNENFAPPEPFVHVLDACTRHDDSWEPRDAKPLLTPEGKPSAFSKELVGTYDAFEEIDLEEYLGVRGRATEEAAKRDPYAAILISMHTVNLLTVQADLSKLNAADRAFHTAFIDQQLLRQAELKDALQLKPDIKQYVTDEKLEAGFKFLQACDSFSLYAGVAFSETGTLQHTHPTRSGDAVEITLIPRGDNHYMLTPYPLDEPKLEFKVLFKRIAKGATANLDLFQSTYSNTGFEEITVTVTAE